MDQVNKQIHGGNIYALARQLACLPDQIIDFSANINPLGISPRALRSFDQTLNNLDHYPDPHCAMLKEQLSDHHRLKPQGLLVGNGSTELIYLLPRALKPKKVLIVSPTFSEYERACRLSGAKIDHLWLRPRDQFRVKIDAIVKKAHKGVDMIFLCNPNNPTGQLLLREEIQWLLKKLSNTSTWVVLDEAFIDYQPEQSLLASPLGGPDRVVTNDSHLVVLRSFTKFFAISGLRVGYLVARPGLIKKLISEKEPWSVNTLAQVAAAESLQDAVYIKESLRFMETERPRYVSALSALPGLLTLPSHANFVLVRLVEQTISVQNLYTSLASEGLLIRDCSSFRGLGPGYFRVAVKRQDDNRRLFQAIRTALPVQQAVSSCVDH
jgi:threonine-phosphate decarboxylase